MEQPCFSFRKPVLVLTDPGVASGSKIKPGPLLASPFIVHTKRTQLCKKNKVVIETELLTRRITWD
jgi:hypothetical protein